ncbi:MAG: amidase domain-containing protein [Clostridiales bacterium]|nr:amidase domain-containing protein [Candidatus Cacconaster stercorequi]
MILHPYRRQLAVEYAHRWAYGRNPTFYDYENIGGDCTNFASQCVYAGTGVMNYTPTFGWYYRSANDKAPAWTGVTYFRNFLVRPQHSPGPVAEELFDLQRVEPGDVIQLSFDGEAFQHSPVVVQVDHTGDPSHIFIAAHSYDADNRPLSTYEYRSLRLLHILGYYQ